jgi:DNA-binding protein HU-beta
MNKSELVEAISKETTLTTGQSKDALNAIINHSTKALKSGDKIALVGFGTFSVAKREARNGRNPQTGKAMKIAAKKVVKFKAGSELAGVVNK